MVDALVGAVIMVVATTSLVYSIEVAQQAFDQAGQYALSASEKALLQDFGLNKDARRIFWENNINIDKSRMQWGEGIE